MQYIQLNPLDSVAVALEDLSSGFTVEFNGQQLNLLADIPAGHKFAIKPIASGDSVIKYGAPIGVSTEAIQPGEHVHVHNVKTGLSGIETYSYNPEFSDADPIAPVTFDGYRRADGKVGTRNEIWVLSTVGCVSRLAERIANKANDKFADSCENLDAVVAFTHPFGCSQTGGDHEQTKRITEALALHPNAGGVLFVGLGCENNQIQALLDSLPPERLPRVRFFNCQNVEDELASGLEKIEELIDVLGDDKREPCPLSDLVIGMKCGGSDGFSGLSANPLVGRISDKVSSSGGTVLLTETPEMFGAEQILMNRAVNAPVYEQTVSLINDFKQYFIDHKQNIYDNPSPGNKAGGITTLEEKSMGAIQKGGTATVTGVLQYGEPVTNKGLNLLQAPGNDAVSSTALSASGATIVLFTTGRGTPLGFPAPTVKIASNSRLASAKAKWIDFDAGRVFDNGGLDKVSDELLSHIVEIASGRIKTKSEINEQREIAIWKSGVTL